jgi:hypothetical protein
MKIAIEAVIEATEGRLWQPGVAILWGGGALPGDRY